MLFFFLEAGFLVLTLLLFLSLGTVLASQLAVQASLAGLLIAGSFAVYRRDLKRLLGTIRKRPLFLCLAAFLGFLALRSLAVVLGWIKLPAVEVFPLKWFAGLGIFLAAYFHFTPPLHARAGFTERERVRRLLWMAAFSGLFLALNALPPLLQTRSFGWEWGLGEKGFFHPFFYSYPFLETYLLSRYTHVNYVGDLAGVGFFSSLGFLVYPLSRLKGRRITLGFLGILGVPAVILLATGGSLLLFLARGTILSFGAALAGYVLILMLKFRDRLLRLLMGGLLAGVLTSFLWIVSPVEVWKEMTTLSAEINPQAKSRSVASTEEGVRRAARIFKSRPFWGVGTGGYQEVSRYFASPEIQAGLREEAFIVRSVAMNHYFHVLAEEGIGAFFYFAFLLFFLFEAFRGLGRTESRFQFIVGLSLLTPVVMILIHGVIHYLMELFPFFVLSCLLMGASLAILQAPRTSA